MARIGQSGSAAGFVFIGTLMAILLIGGVFLVRQQTIQTAASAQGSTSEPVVQQKSEPEKAQEKETMAQESTTNLSTAGKTVELPKTGSTETLGIAMLLAILSYATTSYVRSRRPSLSL